MAKHTVKVAQVRSDTSSFGDKEVPRRVESLTPYGLVTSNYAARLGDEFKFSWPERLMARLWEDENRPRHHYSVPIAVMVTHECSDKCGKGFYIPFADKHEYKMPSPEQVKILSALVQWFGTNIGNRFIRDCLAAMDRIYALPADQREKAFNELFEHKPIT